jgi:replicative DNA helicase
MNDRTGEEALLAAYVQGTMNKIDPDLFTGFRREAARIFEQRGRPSDRAILSVWLSEAGVELEGAVHWFDRHRAPEDPETLAAGLARLSVQRNLATVAREMQELARLTGDQTMDLRSVVDGMVDQAFAPSRAFVEQDETEEAHEMFRRGLAGMETFGWRLDFAPQLMNLIGPLGPPRMMVLTSSQTGQGKTTLASRIALDLIESGARVMYASPDMGALSMLSRFCSMMSGVSAQRIDQALMGWLQLEPLERDVVFEAQRQLEAAGTIFVSSADAQYICRRAREEKMDAVFVDYIQLSYVPGVDMDLRISETNVSAATRLYRSLANEMWVCLVSQSKGGEPALSQLSWSSELKNEAHIVLWLDPVQGMHLWQLLCLKNRGGPQGHVWFYFYPTMPICLELPTTEVGHDVSALVPGNREELAF